MPKSLFINLIGFTNTIPVSAIDENGGYSTSDIHREGAGEAIANLAKHYGLDFVYCTPAFGNEDIIEEIRKNGIDVEELEVK